MKKLYIVILILCFITNNSKAQEIKPNVAVFTKTTKKGIKLKLIPRDVSLWLKGCKEGYEIERRVKNSTAQFESINKIPHLPYEKEEWLKFKNGNEFYKVHQTALKELGQEINHLPLTQQIKKWDEKNAKFSFYFLLTTRFSAFSKASGLEYLDTDVIENTEYEYRIKIKNDVKYSKISSQIFNKKFVKTTPIKAKVGDKSVELSWSHLDPSFFVSYNIEKSKDGINFKAINSAPIYYNEEAVLKDTSNKYLTDHIIRTDSLDKNYTEYYYRLIGLDVWAEQAEPSDIIEVIGVDMEAPSVPLEIVIKEVEDNQLVLEWTYDSPDDLKGFLIFHSHQMNKNYKLLTKTILDQNTRMYKVSDLTEMENQYFKIAVIDTAGNYDYSRSAYGFVRDKTPPVQPKINKIDVDSNGIVEIIWDSIHDRTLKGFMVYTSNSLGTRFNNLTPISVSGTKWKDTVSLHRLNRKRYYKVVAIDQSFNYSPYSEVKIIEIRDTIAPVRCSLNKIKTNGKTVQVSWKSCISKDVAYYKVERKSAGLKWQNVAKIISGEKCFYQDNKPRIGRSQYRITAVDSSNNEGPKSLLREINVRDESIFNPNQNISNLKAKIKNGFVELTWISNKKINKFFRVYRYAEGGKTKLLKMTKDPRIVDTNIEEGRIYHYYVVGQNKKGKRIGKSSTVSLSL